MLISSRIIRFKLYTIEKIHENDSNVNSTAKFLKESSFEKYDTSFVIIQKSIFSINDYSSENDVTPYLIPNKACFLQ